MSEALNDIVIYEDTDNMISLEVRADPESVWLTQAQMADLFDTSRENIVQHIGNIYKEQELDLSRTCKDFLQVRIEGTRQVERKRPHYNLDMILSIGYRVRSKTATQFRVWATEVLKRYLVAGAAINEQRLLEIGKVVNILGRSSDEMISGVADVLDQYSGSLGLLESYDQKSLETPSGTSDVRELEYLEARELIDSMPYSLASELFGREKDDSFKSALATIYQTFGGQDLYPSVQEKAANLLYLIIKNHPFNDGNKRIAAMMFVYFLNLNAALSDAEGRPLIANNTLAAITLMIALSKPDEKEMMCLLVMNMLRGDFE